MTINSKNIPISSINPLYHIKIQFRKYELILIIINDCTQVQQCYLNGANDAILIIPVSMDLQLLPEPRVMTDLEGSAIICLIY